MATQRKGFTLVELSIVLIIIGLIIGGVLKGTDLINSAKQKKFYTTFVKSWQVAANQYQDRTGRILGDGLANGGTAAAATAAATNGLRETRALQTVVAAPNGIQNNLLEVGLDVPVTNTGNSGSYSVEGKYVTALTTGTLRAQSINTVQRNVFQLLTVPTDVAMALDTMIDGTADAGRGDARITAATTSLLVDGPVAGTPWPSADITNGGVATVNMTILF